MSRDVADSYGRSSESEALPELLRGTRCCMESRMWSFSSSESYMTGMMEYLGSLQ